MLGDHRELEPPDPLPNSEVKRLIADGSVGLPHVRVGHRQALNNKALAVMLGLFCYMFEKLTLTWVPMWSRIYEGISKANNFALLRGNGRDSVEPLAPAKRRGAKRLYPKPQPNGWVFLLSVRKANLMVRKKNECAWDLTI